MPLCHLAHLVARQRYGSASGETERLARHGSNRERPARGADAQRAPPDRRLHGGEEVAPGVDAGRPPEQYVLPSTSASAVVACTMASRNIVHVDDGDAIVAAHEERRDAQAGETEERDECRVARAVDDRRAEDDRPSGKS